MNSKALALASTAFLLTCGSTARLQAQRPPPEPQALVCHSIHNGGIVKLVRESVVPRHLAHDDCRVVGSPAVGTACDLADPDGDDVCGTDGMTCGEGHGPGGVDNPCLCGETVVTDTRIDAGFDPVAGATCAADGLVVGQGVQLDLSGITLAGSDSGTGLSIHGSGLVTGGTIQGFDVGLHVAPTAPGAVVFIDGTTLRDNLADGVLVDVLDAQGRVVFDRLVAEENGGDGLHVRSAPGASNLDDAADVPTESGYGVAFQGVGLGLDSAFRNNLGYGIHLGDPAQAADVSALIGGVQVHGNGAGGVLLEQRSDLAPGSDCGASAAQPGCTGMTLLNNNIHTNIGSGVELRSGTLIPFTSNGLGFRLNWVHGNAMAAASCSAAQSAPQVSITGPVGLGNGACSAAASPQACLDANSPVNQHCVWDASIATCRVAWDLRGDATSCETANMISGYNNSGVGANDVGMRATGGAIVWAANNNWISVPKVSVDTDSLIVATPACAPIGCSQ